jgi:pimeloyl-ACP methyl ester carboxylesterase
VQRDLLLGEEWAALGTPTLVILGDRDAFVTTSVASAWGGVEARNENVQVVRVPDAGHLPWLDAPAATLESIEGFLTE